jgi:hypothetical protein
MNLLIRPDGTVECIYAESVDLSTLGTPDIERASHVEPDKQGRWWAKIKTRFCQTNLGPFPKRSAAIAAEVRFLTEHMEHRCQDHDPGSG